MSREAIEATLRRDPGDEHAWAVFGDLLAEAGDTRGELIALEQRARASERPFERSLLEHQARELFDREHRRWLGPLADAGLELVWDRGFAREVVISRAHVATLRALLALPTAALLGRLVLVRPRGLTSLVQLLRAHERPLAAVEIRGLAPEVSLAPLAELDTLVEVGIEGHGLADVDALACLPELTTLRLRRCTGALDGLANFAGRRLTTLEVSAHVDAVALGPDALVPLAALTELRELDLGDAGWSSAEPLAALDRLERLDLRSSGVFTLEPLRELFGLCELHCSGCTGLTNLEPLASLTALERLRLAYTRVRDLRPLMKLVRLEQLDLAGTPVTEVYPLFELPSLRKLGLQACEVADVGPLIARGVAVHGIRPPERSWRDLAEDLLRRG